MGELNVMFNGPGPALSGLEGGLEDIRKAEADKVQNALRQAQMNEILQRTAQAKETAPLDLEAKQLKLKEDKRASAIKQLEDRSDLLNNMIPGLQQTPPAARLAYMQKFAADNGMPIDPQHLEVFGRIDPNKLPDFLNKQRLHDITTSAKYRQAMDLEMERGKRQENVARINAQSRENVAAARNKGVASIQDAVRSGKMTAEKAAVSLYGAAQFETDPAEQQKLLNMAAQYEQFAMNQRNAQAGGKVDIGAAANLPTLTIPPALGGAPKLGTAENPIDLTPKPKK